MSGELAEAVCNVMREVSYVEETGKNKFHNYKYASDEDLLRAIQPAMASQGLALIPHRVSTTTVEHTPDNKGKAQWRTELLVTYRLLHTSGEEIEVQAAGCGIDGEDKGLYKAMTGALKYALRHMFLVPTGDDAERAREERPAAAKGGQSKPAEPANEEPAAPEPDAEPDAGVIDQLAKEGWEPRERVAVEVRDFFRWLGIEGDPWAMALDRQRKLPTFCKEKQAELDAWIAWRGDLAGLLTEAKLTADHLCAWLEANDRPPVNEMNREQREKLIGFLRDAGGIGRVRDLITKREAA